MAASARARALRALPAVATAAHQLFELAVGSGVIGQARAGLLGAAGLSAGVEVAWVAAALDRRREWERTLSTGAGVAVAAPALHYTLFPWQRWRGVPILNEAEGLGPGPLLTAYNAVLYAWALSGAAGLAATPRGRRRWAVVGACAAVAFRALAREHLVWIAAEARRNSAWWNRAWRSDTVRSQRHGFSGLGGGR